MDLLLLNKSSAQANDAQANDAQAVRSRPRPSYTRASRAGEDWKGITDPALRKKLQNKLNQRAQRARRTLLRKQQKKWVSQSKNSRKDIFILPSLSHEQEAEKFWQPKSLSEAISMMARFNAAAYARYYTANPCLDQLLTLTKFNLLRAFVDNMEVLGLTMQDMEDDVVSPFNLPSPTLHKSLSRSLPGSLYPTTKQRSIPHHPWLDCFPFPRMRDNLLLVVEFFNDCELCTDLMDPANGDIGMLVWGDPWLPQNWEVSEFFVQKWFWVIQGCPEILLSSNYWRARRGLTKIDLSGLSRQ